MLPDLPNILHLLRGGFHNVRILVVGDLMLDRYIHGDVDRVSPEAPVPVLRHVQRYDRAGGAANVAMNLAGLGCPAFLAGFWGDDTERRDLAHILDTAGIDTLGVVPSNLPTISKTRIVGRNQQLLRLDIESRDPPPAIEAQRLQDRVLELLPKVHAVILSDYNKGALTPELTQAVIQAARAQGIPVLADPKTPDFSKYAGATTASPNLHELSLATGIPTEDTVALLAAGQRLAVQQNIQFLTVTMSEHGISIVHPHRITHFRARAREVFDVSGAGDTVIATLAAFLAAGTAVPTAVELANLAAGIVVGKVGTVPVSAPELAALLTPNSSLPAAEKILTPDALKARVEQWRSNGETVVFTNGCFDLLHIGHITLLEQCRRFGTKLILGLNSDSSIRGLKGPSRPIVGEAERARIMAALAAVDAVTLFSEPTPRDLIASILPDVLVKGGDYTVEAIAGHEDVLAHGGRVELIPIVEGFSTSNLVSKLSTPPPHHTPQA